MSNDLAARLQRSLGQTATLERELGGGGMARVFLAADHGLDRKVVVKVLDLEGDGGASAERFRREVKVIGGLQHPHIVRILAAGGDDSLLWYVMPYEADESLRARLSREGALPLADAMRLAHEVFDALAYAHDHGIAHRDIKPENILLEGRHAVVADFGIAKALSEAGVGGSGLTSVGVAIGTPAYMAPEQAMADPTTNHRANLYAAGAVFYEMLAGAPPYAGAGQAVVAAHLSATIPRIEERRGDVPPGVAALIQRLLAKNPAERPQSAHEVVTALEHVTTPGGSGIAWTPTTTSGNAGTSAAATVGPRVALFGAGVALAVVGAMWFWRSADAGPVVAGADVIAVMPVGTTDPALAQLGRDLAVTLATSLDGVGSLRAADAMTVLMAAGDATPTIPLDAALAIGRKVRATSVLHGSMVREGSAVRVRLGLHPVAGGAALAEVSARASADSIRPLTDSLAVALLREVWRKGIPPSPFLSAVATSSPEALRAFLDGERAFAQMEMGEARGAYARAIAADSQFAQAYYRYDYSLSWNVLPPDSAIQANLMRLRHRLPVRDQQLLALRTGHLPFLERLDSARVLAARFPDHPIAQYEAADRVIHSGPIFGVPIADALPYLDQLESVAPDNADYALHRWMVAETLGDTAAMLRAAVRLALDTANIFASYADAPAFMDARRRGQVVPESVLRPVIRRMARLPRQLPAFRWIPDAMAPDGWTTAEQVAALRMMEQSAEFTDLRGPIMAFRAYLETRNGEHEAAVATFARLESSDAPRWLRVSGAQLAGIGAWLGTVDVALARATLERAETTVPATTGDERATYVWLRGVVALAADDSVGVRRAIADLAADTTPDVADLARSLRALARERATGQVDSLIVLEDELIRAGRVLVVALPVHRLAIGRALVRAGDPVRAERYLAWPDARTTTEVLAAMRRQYASLTAYERGVAAEAAGDRHRAVLHLQRFVDAMRDPAPALQASVEDARARLQRLAAGSR